MIKKNNPILLGAVVLIGGLILGAATAIVIDQDILIRGKSKIEVQTVFDLNDNFSKEKVRAYLIELHVKYPDVAVAQMELESASGTSRLALEQNNLFGMQLSSIRPTTALGEKNGFAYYSHWRQSCIDYCIFAAYNMNEENNKTQDTWLRFIGKYYAEDPLYLKRIRDIINKNGGDISNKRKL